MSLNIWRSWICKCGLFLAPGLVAAAVWWHYRYRLALATLVKSFRRFKSQGYIYTELDEDSREIRILTLLPGPFDAPIHIVLEPYSFTDESVPSYEALSYTWGQVEHPQTIWVGEDRFSKLEVTDNLAKALPYLRHEAKPRRFWIDAICINQQDLGERSSQVKRMPEIYSQASGVVVWLGPEKDESALAMSLLQDMGSGIVVDWNAYTSVSISDANLNVVDGSLTVAEERIAYSKEELSAIAALLSRHWFERLWIVQEICLACPNTSVQCGNTTMSWNDLSNSIFLLHTKRWEWYDPLEEQKIRARLYDIVTFIRIRYRSCNPFKTLLEATKNQNCSDPRDRVFAVLSLAEDLYMQPDYTKSISDTFQAVTLHYLKTTRSLDTVVSMGLRQNSDTGPTWIPDWSNLPRTNPIPPHLASGESEAVFHCEGNLLSVRGISVGTVSQVESFELSGLTRTAYVKMDSEIRRVIYSFFENKVASSEDLSALAQTLIPNALAHNYHPKDENDPTLQETIAYLATFIDSNGTIANADGDMADENPRIKRILDHIQFFCCDRALFCTDEGSFGLGPQTLRKGDLVTVLLGSNLPAALRPTNCDKWQVVGETYLHGFGDNEALLGPLDDGVTVVSRLDDGVGSWAYLNEKTGELASEDPRLGMLPPNWTRKQHEEQDRWTWFVNEQTGEERSKDIGDPRLDIGELEKLDVRLREFVLV
jgi:hypothetical protein